MPRVQGLSTIGKQPNRDIRSERFPKDFPYVMPNDQLWRDLEDAGHIIRAFNDGQMLRIDSKIDIYVRSLKWRPCQTQIKFKPVTWRDKKSELIQILDKTKAPFIPMQHDDSPVIPRGTRPAAKRYRKSI